MQAGFKAVMNGVMKILPHRILLATTAAVSVHRGSMVSSSPHHIRSSLDRLPKDFDHLTTHFAAAFDVMVFVVLIVGDRQESPMNKS